MKFITMAFELPRIICVHLFGQSHTEVHRICVGMVIAIVGVNISFASSLCPHIVHFAGDFCGWGLHGIGLTPIIEKISNNVNNKPPLA